MAYICDNCGKKGLLGRSQRHGRGVAGKRWRKRAQVTVRSFKPNLQKVAVLISGKKASLLLCTDCLSKFRKEGKLKSYSNVVVG
ncbi:MAG: L28 family ribosomal protein [Patescibacteria group bacterium]